MGSRHLNALQKHPAETARDRIRALLEERRVRVQAEIVNYPSPIPACDAHFNHLLEERGHITDELARLDELAVASGDAIKRIDAFLKTSRYLDEKTSRDISESVSREW